jgi:putative endonuclease
MTTKSYFVYMVASRSRTLYIGFTNNLEERIYEHRDGLIEGFTKQYQCNRLVWFEVFRDVNAAIEREKQLKGWVRRKKIALLEKENPTWEDLSESWGKSIPQYPWRREEKAGPSTPLRSAQDDKSQ